MARRFGVAVAWNVSRWPAHDPGMANLGFNLTTDLGDRIALWARQFAEETTFKRYERACAYVMDESAKRLAERMNEATEDVVDNPTTWMKRAWAYRRGLSKQRRRPGEVSADTYVLDDQSIVMKFLVGDGPNVRRPGDVGLAKDRILLPNWRNLALTQGIRPDRHGNLPGSVAARLNREAGGTVAKRRVKGRWGVYKGEIPVGGSRLLGYIVRPPRVKAPLGKNGRMIWVNQGRPRILLVAVHKSVLQVPYEVAVRDVMDGIPELMAAELDDAIAYQQRIASGR
ncbi:hypothetical protein ACYQR9_15550 [Methylobacterium sp. CM6241]